MDFGSITLGTTITRTFTLTNQGGAVSGIPNINVEYLTAPRGTVTATGCSAALAPGASCVLTIKATPTALGLFQAFVRVTANPGAPDSGSLSIHVVGWAIGFEVSPSASIDLGDVAPGVSIQRDFRVTALIDLVDLKVVAGGEDLAIEPISTCTAVLSKGASCLVNVEFVARSLGWKRVGLGFRAGGDLGQFVSVEFTANVSKASDLSIAPKAPPTYTCIIEKTSAPVVFTVTNVSAAPSGQIIATIVGESASDFRIASTDCSTLAPNATCAVSVVCSPPMSASAAIRHAILSVTDGNTQLSVPLTAEVTF
jgi:hypothetical protein